MKRFFVAVVAGVFSALSLTAFAQMRDISVLAGVNVPMYQEIENDAVVVVSYGQFYRNGLGFRAGLQWSPSVADLDNAFGVPVAFAFRTMSRTSRERLMSGVAGSVYAMDYDPYIEADDRARSMLNGFLMNLFSDMEFFVGLTPGYVAGASGGLSYSTWGDSWQYKEEAWTERKNAFSLSIDAGMCLNYSIWRFDIKLMPAFHYNLTNNYVYHRQTVEKGVSISKLNKPLRWAFTFCGGIAYRFD